MSVQLSSIPVDPDFVLGTQMYPSCLPADPECKASAEVIVHAGP